MQGLIVQQKSFLNGKVTKPGGVDPLDLASCKFAAIYYRATYNFSSRSYIVIAVVRSPLAISCPP